MQITTHEQPDEWEWTSHSHVQAPALMSESPRQQSGAAGTFNERDMFEIYIMKVRLGAGALAGFLHSMTGMG
jgi:hypothetical protein